MLVGWGHGLTEWRSSRVDRLGCDIGRSLKSCEKTTVQLECNIRLFEDFGLQILIFACTCIHPISVPLLDLLHIPNRTRSIPAELLEVIEAQASTIFEAVRLRESPPDELTATQVPKVPDVRMSEKRTRVRRFRERL